MQISVGKGNKTFKPVEVFDLDDLASHATKSNWSQGVFKDNHRKISNFVSAECIGLDFDNENPEHQLSLEEAKEKFKNFKHIIMTTKSHQKEKNGEIKDRFRVVLFFSRPVTDKREFYATYNLIKHKIIPSVDPACSDPSRMWYPSREVVSVLDGGATIEPVEPRREEPRKPESVSEFNQGTLSKATYKFLLEGAIAGQRNAKLYKAARDCFEQGMSESEFLERLENMIKTTGNWGTKHVNETDKKTVTSAYTGEARYEPRKAFNIQNLSEIMQSDLELTFLVDGLLIEGGISVLAGDPKAGKSTLVRQLMLSVARGHSFLEREVKKGKCLYLALEEHVALIKHEISRQGAMQNEPNIFFHVGAPKTKNFIEELEEILINMEIKFLVVDTFMLAAKLKDINLYSDTNEIIQTYREMARNSDCHIMFIHHTNKGEGFGTNRISGSQAIHGAVDNAIMFMRSGRDRVITTSQRGGKNFVNQTLNFDIETFTYSLGDEVEDEF